MVNRHLRGRRRRPRPTPGRAPRGLQGAVEGVEHREQVADESLGGAGHDLVTLPHGALAVVLELGRHPLQVAEVGGGLLLRRAQRLEEVVAHASPPSSTISASTTSPSPLPPEGPAAVCEASYTFCPSTWAALSISSGAEFRSLASAAGSPSSFFTAAIFSSTPARSSADSLSPCSANCFSIWYEAWSA